MLENIIYRTISKKERIESTCSILKGMNELEIYELIKSYGKALYVSHDGICLYDDGDYSIEITFLDCIFRDNILCGKSLELYVINGTGSLSFEKNDNTTEQLINENHSKIINIEPGHYISYTSYENLFRLHFFRRILCLAVYDMRKCESDIEYCNNELHYIDSDKNTSRIKNIISLSSAYPKEFSQAKFYFLYHHDHSVRLKYIIEYLKGRYGSLDYNYINTFLEDNSNFINKFLSEIIDYDNN